MLDRKNSVSPPCGVRLEASAEIYSSLHDFLEQHNNPKAYILTASQKALEAISRPVKQRTDLVHGGLNVSLFAI